MRSKPKPRCLAARAGAAHEIAHRRHRGSRRSPSPSTSCMFVGFARRVLGGRRARLGRLCDPLPVRGWRCSCCLGWLGTSCCRHSGRAAAWVFVWARMVRDAATEVLPFSQLGGIVFGARAAILQGVAPPLAFASTVVDVTTELLAQIAFVALGLAILSDHAPRSAFAASLTKVLRDRPRAWPRSAARCFSPCSATASG